MTTSLGGAIKLCRTSRGYTQAALAKVANISISHLCLIEKNRRDPSWTTINRLAEALNVPPAVLVFLAQDAIPELPDDQVRLLRKSIMGLIDNVSGSESEA